MKNPHDIEPIDDCPMEGCEGELYPEYEHLLCSDCGAVFDPEDTEFFGTDNDPEAGLTIYNAHYFLPTT